MAVGFLATAIAVRGMPYISHRTSLADQFMLIPALFDLFWAAASLAAAWLLSRWAHGCAGAYRASVTILAPHSLNST